MNQQLSLEEAELDPVDDDDVRSGLEATLEQLQAERRRLDTQDLRRARQRVRSDSGYDDRVVAAETQIMIDGQPSTVSELVRSGPGESTPAAAGRATALARQEEDLVADLDQDRPSTGQRAGMGL